MDDRFRHISFRKTWKVTGRISYQIGQCRGINRAISEMPIPPGRHARLLEVSLRKGALATTAIEGNTLSLDEVEKLQREEPLPESKAYQEREVSNVLKAMNQLLQDGRNPAITPEFLLECHRIIGAGLGDHFDAAPGRWRTDSRAVGRYRTPDFRDVPEMVRRLCDWLPRAFRAEGEEGSYLDAVLKAIVAHVYIEWIHPFGDGNGRTGRLLEYYVLLRAGSPAISSHILSNFYNSTRPEYYRQLEVAGRSGGELTGFVEYAVRGLLDGLIETLAVVQEGVFVSTWRTHVFDVFAQEKFRKTVFKRRRNLALAMKPGKSYTADELLVATSFLAKAYATVTPRTLARDLNAIQEMDLVASDPDGRFRAKTEALVRQTPGAIGKNL